MYDPDINKQWQQGQDLINQLIERARQNNVYGIGQGGSGSSGSGGGGGGSANYSDAAHAGGGSSYQYINGAWYSVSSRTGFKQKVNTHVDVGPDGKTLVYYDQYHNVIGPYNASTGAGTKTGTQYGPGGGMSSYEAAQLKLERQRLLDAEKAEAAQEAYQKEQQRIARSNAIESANQAFRDTQLKSTYGTINGMAYGSAKGAPIAQMLPESELMKDAYANTPGAQDPWKNAGPLYAGNTGATYMNPEQPGLFSALDKQYQTPTSGVGSVIPSQNMPPASSWSPRPQPVAGPISTSSGANQFQEWHDLAHQLQSAPMQTTPQGIPSMASGGIVPGNLGQPQLIEAHGGETIIPAMDRQPPTMATPWDVAEHIINRGPGPIQGYAMGGVVPTDGGIPTSYNSALGPTFQDFLDWHNDYHSRPGGGFIGPPNSFPSPKPTQPPAPIYNSYGQPVGSSVSHGPQDNDILPAQRLASGNTWATEQTKLGHVPYSPVLTGLSGYGATITPNGTPVVMSNWQRSHLMPSSVSGPGGYNDYAMQISGWNPTDLQQLGQDMTGNFARDLSAPTHFNPISVTPAPAGG